ncbi:MAG: TPM domain-containing protein [Bacteroidaceae bacterium]|nr:TPM domain-containing protein [Bacteroidaceae bacterium]
MSNLLTHLIQQLQQDRHTSLQRAVRHTSLRRAVLFTLLLGVAHICALPTLLAATYTVDNLPIPYLQDKTQYVSNPDNILSQTAVDSLNLWLGQMEDEHGVQTVLAVVERIQGGETYDFCMALARKYGIGSKQQNSGLVILLSTGDRAYTILTGRGLEGTLPDAICKRIENRQMLPALREGDWDEAMLNTVRAVKAYIDGDDSLVGSSDFDDDDDIGALIGFCVAMFLGLALIGLAIWYDNRKKAYCPSCHQHTMKKISSRVTKNKRLGLRTHHDTYRCTHCFFIKELHWDEDIRSGSGGAAAGGALGGSFFGSGGGHSFGGSFGGGSFGGGGASGRF